MLLGDLLPPRFPLSPLLIPHLSPLPLFLICSCNPPHPSPSALLLFLSPSPSYMTVFKLMSTSPSDHAQKLLTQVVQSLYRGEKGRMGCTLRFKNQVIFVAVLNSSDNDFDPKFVATHVSVYGVRAVHRPWIPIRTVCDQDSMWIRHFPNGRYSFIRNE